ncbi:MAG TPA: TonB-dependent receptor [Acidobacteriota bacterium]
MMLHRRLQVLLFVFVTLPLGAQVDRANLSGTVSDSSGAVIAGAKVEAVSTGTALRRETITGPDGGYNIPGLPIGSYTVTISKEGFKAIQYKDLELSVGQSRTLDAQMEVSALATQVEVVAAAAPLNRSSAEVGGVIESQQVRDIPLNGRNWASLMMLAPGAINVGGGSQTSIRFVGRSRDDNNFTFDGIDASGVQEQPQKADARLNISLDSIAEFRVNSAVYTAESGTTGGGQINVVSKTGSNEFHGGLFEFLRNDIFDSRSPFDPPKLPPFRLNQFGADLGGPIAKNRSFFFANYEGLRQRLGQTLNGFVPSADFRQRVLAASPALQPLVQAYPAGQTRVDANIDQLTVQGRNAVREDYGMIRFDHRFTDNTTMFIRYNIDDVFIDKPNGALGSRDTTAIRPSNLVLQLQHIFSPRVINEAKVGMNRSAFNHPTVGIVPVTVSVPGFDDLPSSALDLEVGTTFNYVDNLTVIRGPHTWKMGVEIRRVQLNNSGNAIDNTSISYASRNDFINNAVDSVSVNAALGIGGMRRTLWMGYGQDEIKVNPNLTLNLGLRYEYYSVMHEVLGRAAVVDVVGCGGFCPPGTPYYSPDRNNFAPRLGLAWSPALFKEHTVIRTGFGMYYSPGQNDDFSDPHESTAGRFSLSSADVSNLSYPITPFLAKLQAQGVSPKGIDRNRRDLYYENWDFLIQQQLPHSFVGQVGYIGSEGHKLFTNRPANLLDPVTRKRPLPQFGQFGVKRNDANSNFHALQASLQRSFTDGWLWQSQYMWSHAIADGSVGAGESISVQNASCRACDRSNTNFDVRHTITMNSIYQLPFGQGQRYFHANGVGGKLIGGWELSGLATASSGRPVNIVVTRSASDMPDGNRSNQRPDRVPGEPIYPTGGQTIFHWFNPAAFKVPAKGTWGNAGRNIGRGPGYWETDLGIEKRTPVSEHTSVSFRAEAFNLLNHPIYGNPAANISSLSTFGRITSVLNNGATGIGTPRRMQFMLRLEF